MPTLGQQVEREIIRKDKLKIRLEKSIENDRARMHKIREKMNEKEALLEKLTEENYKDAKAIEDEKTDEDEKS